MNDKVDGYKRVGDVLLHRRSSRHGVELKAL
jgi:hypothetical protein